MKIYLAARFSKRSILERWAEELQELGHEIVSRWALRDSDHKLVDGLSPKAETSERIRFAQEDEEDMDKCDCIISLMEKPRGGGRGGRHVEFGYCRALKKRLIIIGPRETVFHELPAVEQFNSFEEFLATISEKCNV